VEPLDLPPVYAAEEPPPIPAPSREERLRFVLSWLKLEGSNPLLESRVEAAIADPDVDELALITEWREWLSSLTHPYGYAWKRYRAIREKLDRALAVEGLELEEGGPETWLIGGFQAENLQRNAITCLGLAHDESTSTTQ
jgi:hypothetical protein